MSTEAKFCLCVQCQEEVQYADGLQARPLRDPLPYSSSGIHKYKTKVTREYPPIHSL